MKRWHRRQSWAFGLYGLVAVVFVSWISTYVKARSHSVSTGCWGPPVRSVVIPPALPSGTCAAFIPLAKIDQWINGEFVDVVSARELP